MVKRYQWHGKENILNFKLPHVMKCVPKYYYTMEVQCNVMEVSCSCQTRSACIGRTLKSTWL